MESSERLTFRHFVSIGQALINNKRDGFVRDNLLGLKKAF